MVDAEAVKCIQKNFPSDITRRPQLAAGHLSQQLSIFTNTGKLLVFSVSGGTSATLGFFEEGENAWFLRFTPSIMVQWRINGGFFIFKRKFLIYPRERRVDWLPFQRLVKKGN